MFPKWVKIERSIWQNSHMCVPVLPTKSTSFKNSRILCDVIFGTKSWQSINLIFSKNLVEILQLLQQIPGGNVHIMFIENRFILHTTQCHQNLLELAHVWGDGEIFEDIKHRKFSRKNVNYSKNYNCESLYQFYFETDWRGRCFWFHNHTFDRTQWLNQQLKIIISYRLLAGMALSIDSKQIRH